MGVFYASLVASILFGVAGQVALKAGAVDSATLLDQFLNPRTILGFGIYAIAAFLYIAALKRIPVSIAFPSVAASYIIVAILAHFLWNEPLGWPQIAGMVLIGGGIFLIHQH
jgi:undecaprenyl phosphate-alpha-L-ara4N flippase subunit ArnE